MTVHDPGPGRWLWRQALVTGLTGLGVLAGETYLPVADWPVVDHEGAQATHFLALGAIRERQHLEAFLELVEPRDVVWDVGACVGAYSVAIKAWEPSARVRAIEPHPGHAEVLRVHGERWGFQVDEIAAGAERSNVRMRVGDGINPGSQIAAPGDRANGPTVQQRPLDDLHRAGSPAPDVIKVDVQGQGPEVLEGAETVLDRARAVLVEAHDNADELRAPLEAEGFDLERTLGGRQAADVEALIYTDGRA